MNTIIIISRMDYGLNKQNVYWKGVDQYNKPIIITKVYNTHLMLNYESITLIRPIKRKSENFLGCVFIGRDDIIKAFPEFQFPEFQFPEFNKKPTY